MLDYVDINYLKNLNSRAGYHFFSTDTMRFFNSRVMRNVYAGKDGWYFVTSEQFDHNAPRYYTVRKMYPDGSVKTVGEFQEYETRDKAIRAAKNYALNERE